MKASRPSFFRCLVFSGFIAASAGFVSDAFGAVYTCVPRYVGAFPSRVHVLCTAPAAGGISYFAVCTEGNSATASRALSAFTTAKVTGKSLQIYYTSADTSGTACGCLASDCRLASGVEVLQ